MAQRGRPKGSVNKPKPEFDIKDFLNKPENKQLLANAFIDGLNGKRTNSQLFKLITQLTGDLVEKREDNVKVEFTTNDRVRIAIELRETLRRELEDTGTCPICCQHKTLHEPYIPAGREQQQESPVEAVGLLT